MQEIFSTKLTIDVRFLLWGQIEVMIQKLTKAHNGLCLQGVSIGLVWRNSVADRAGHWQLLLHARLASCSDAWN